MTGQLDVFAHGRVLLAEGRNMDVVTQFQRITDSLTLASDLQLSAGAAVVVEVADKVLEERHPQPELFRIVAGAITHLAAPGASGRVEVADYLMRVLVELGYAPELRVCARCGRGLGEMGLGFSPFAGGVTCADCNASVPGARQISARAVKVLRVCASGDRDLLLRLRLDGEDLVALEAALEAQLEHQLDRQLKSLDFARRVRSN
jgi:DNA repair protein RecO (recombination protein O)